MLPTDDICDCKSLRTVDLGVPGRFMQLSDCLHCSGAGVFLNSLSLPEPAAEMDQPKDPRDNHVSRCVVLNGCDFAGGSVDQLWKHAMDSHLQHVVILEDLEHTVMLPFGVEWMGDTKRFLVRSTFGVYLVSLQFLSLPVMLMVTVEGLDGHWRDFEIVFHDTSDTFWSAKVRARTLKEHDEETVYHKVDTSKGTIAESLPLVYIKACMDDSNNAKPESSADPFLMIDCSSDLDDSWEM